MGYSVSVKFKNHLEKERMKKFLLQNMDLLQSLQKIEPYNGYSFHNEPMDGTHLGYAPKIKNLLGFHGTIIPAYIWNLCAWMSVKSQSQKGNDHYFYYDDEPMIVTQDINNFQDTLVDSRGIRIVNPNKQSNALTTIFDTLLHKKRNFKQSYKLFEELEDKWDKFLLIDKNSIHKKVKP